jgi:hypothetical protein
MDASLQEIRVGVFGRGDDVLLISDPPDASRVLALEYVADHDLTFWGVMEFQGKHIGVLCENDMECIAGMVRAAPLFAKLIVAKHGRSFAIKKLTESWELLDKSASTTAAAMWN